MIVWKHRLEALFSAASELPAEEPASYLDRAPVALSSPAGNMQRGIRVVLEHPVATLAIVALLTLGFGLAAAGVRIDNSAAVWLPSGDPEVEQHERFRERFGDDAFLIAATGELEAFDAPTLDALVRVRAALERVDGVLRVDSPLDDEGRLPLAEARGGALQKLLDALDPKAAGELLARPLAQVLIGERRLALSILPRADSTARERMALIGEIESVLGGAGAALGPWDLAGTDVVTRDLDRGSRTSFGGLFPLVLALMAAVLLVVLRSWRCVAAIALAAAAASVWAIGALALCGRTLNLLLVLVPAILAVMTTAYALHLLSRFLQLEPGDGDARDGRIAAWQEAARHTQWPCLLTALTTAAGFASLGLSSLPPVRDLGIFAGLGVLFGYALVFSLVPALLVLSPRVRPRGYERARWTPARSASYVAALGRHRRLILAGGLLLAALGAVGIGRLRVESHVLRFFPPDHALTRSYERIEEDFFGLTSIELWLEGSAAALCAPRSLRAIDEFLRTAEREPLLSGLPVVWPFAGALAELGPEARSAALFALLPADGERLELPSAARSFLWFGERRIAVRATLAARTDSSNAAHELVEGLRSMLSRADFAPGVVARISGAAPLLVRGQVLLLSTQVSSFVIALGVVSLALFAAFRSVSIVAVSLIPNLLPIGSTLGLMGLVGIPLDSATVTVAGIALGLVVDDTIHFLYAWRRARAATGSTRTAAVECALTSVGPPILITSLALALGFGAFCLAPFPPTALFGLLIAVTGLTAVLCDLVLLPAVLSWRDSDGLRKTRAAPEANSAQNQNRNAP